MISEKSYIYEHYIDYIFSKSTSFSDKGLSKLVSALIENSKQEIKENHHPFCLDKINEIFEYNSSRLTKILPLLWPTLSKYYVELGQNKI